MPWQSARIVGIEPLTERIRSYLLELSEAMPRVAGQHVDVRLTAPDGYRAMRSYSIASAPENANVIEIAVELLDGGEVSSFFHEVVAVGDEIELRGALGGHFIWTEAEGGPLLLMGGGSGVVPLVSMIRAGQISGFAPPTVLVLSARCLRDVPFRDELLRLDDACEHFHLVLTTTREKPRRVGDYGRRIDGTMVSNALSMLPTPPQHIYICGSNAFVNAAATGALEAELSPGRIRTERYGA